MPGAVAHSPCGEARAGTRTNGWSGAVAHSPRGEARRRVRPRRESADAGCTLPYGRRGAGLPYGQPDAGARSLAGGAEHAFLGTPGGEHMFATVTINPLDKACQVSLARKIGWWGGAGARIYAELPAIRRDDRRPPRDTPRSRGNSGGARHRAGAGEGGGGAPRGQRGLRSRRRHPSGRCGGGPGAGRGPRRGAGRPPGHGDEVDDGAHAGRLGGGPSRRGGQGHRVGDRAPDDQLRAPRRRPGDRLRAGRSAPAAPGARAVQLLRLRGQNAALVFSAPAE